MLSLVELKRRLENIVQIGQVSATKNQDGKALARVVVHDVGEDKRVTDFLPVLSLANSFFRVFFPIRVGEQVLVISLFGDANKGFILRSIFNKSCKEPDGASDTRTVIEFEDGTVVYYDTKTKIKKTKPKGRRTLSNTHHLLLRIKKRCGLCKGKRRSNKKRTSNF